MLARGGLASGPAREEEVAIEGLARGNADAPAPLGLRVEHPAHQRERQPEGQRRVGGSVVFGIHLFSFFLHLSLDFLDEV